MRRRYPRNPHDADPRLLIVVGPCSIHDPRAGLEYATRLRGLIERVTSGCSWSSAAYFEKSRTSVGWKGPDHGPAPRRIGRYSRGACGSPGGNCRDIIDMGVPTATELLDPITPQYIADLICWSAVGVRTTESQTHRQMASGLSMPLGFKNATLGPVTPAVERDQGRAAAADVSGHQRRRGGLGGFDARNPDCHLVLRGGDSGPNYSAQHVADAERQLTARGRRSRS